MREGGRGRDKEGEGEIGRKRERDYDKQKCHIVRRREGQGGSGGLMSASLLPQ